LAIPTFSGSLTLAHDTQNLIDDNYLDKYEGIGDYAREMTKSCTEIPHSIEYYITLPDAVMEFLIRALFFKGYN